MRRAWVAVLACAMWGVAARAGATEPPAVNVLAALQERHRPLVRYLAFDQSVGLGRDIMVKIRPDIWELLRLPVRYILAAVWRYDTQVEYWERVAGGLDRLSIEATLTKDNPAVPVAELLRLRSLRPGLYYVVALTTAIAEADERWAPLPGDECLEPALIVNGTPCEQRWDDPKPRPGKIVACVPMDRGSARIVVPDPMWLWRPPVTGEPSADPVP